MLFYGSAMLFGTFIVRDSNMGLIEMINKLMYCYVLVILLEFLLKKYHYIKICNEPIKPNNQYSCMHGKIFIPTKRCYNNKGGCANMNIYSNDYHIKYSDGENMSKSTVDTCTGTVSSDTATKLVIITLIQIVALAALYMIVNFR